MVEAWLGEFWALLYQRVRWVQLCGSLNFFGIAFLWYWNENWPFLVLWPLLSFPNLMTYWVQHFDSIISLTSPSRMSGSRWMITLSWLSGSWRSFLYSSSVYSRHLFLISSASVRSIQFLSGPYNFCLVHTISFLYCTYLWMKVFLGTFNFLEEISRLYHSIVFLYFFALITEEGFLISPCCSLVLCIQMGISFLSSFAFSFSSFLSYL